MDISVVIPVYNETARLPDNLAAISRYMEDRFAKSEIIVVEDGSGESVEEFINNFTQDVNVLVRYFSHHPNRGKGYSVRRGVLESQGELVAYLDADGATPVSEMDRLLLAVKDGADVALGSRALVSAETKVEKTVHRFLMGRIFAFIVNLATGLDIEDTQCGFKLFKKTAAMEVFGELETEGFSFDVEVLGKAKARGYTLKEVAVNWHDVAGSKVRLSVDSWKMFLDVIRIAFRLRRFNNKLSSTEG